MLPPPARSIAGMAYLQPRKTPLRLTRITSSHVSSVVSVTDPSSAGNMPALLKRTSSVPYLFSAAAIIASTSRASDTSAWTNSALPPAFSISATVSRPAASLTSATTTFAPSRANRRADSRPMPLPAPVMTATLPESLPMSTPLEKPSPLPARHDLVELALLGPQEVEVMGDDLLAESLFRERALLEKLDRLSQAPGHAPKGLRGIHVPGKGSR